MAVKPILLLGNPVLRVKCKPVKQFNTPTLRNLIVAQRVIFIHVDEPIALINPLITQRSKTLFSLWDDCFSFPNLLVKVKRHSRIGVRYQNEAGERQELKANGALSELLQHEVDHINGILAIDRAISSKHIIFRSERDKTN